MTDPTMVAAGKITREKVRVSLTANPVQTLKQVGDPIGISKERVRQIIQEEGFHRVTPERPNNAPNCSSCGKRRKKLIYKRSICSICNPNPARRITLTCGECGTKFQRPTKQVKSKGLSFCNKFCQGRYLAKHYGPGTEYRRKLIAMREAQK